MPSPPNYTSANMQIDGSRPRFKKLTDDEKQRRRKLGLCLYCGTAGHLANTCPTRPPTPENDLKGSVQAK